MSEPPGPDAGPGAEPAKKATPRKPPRTVASAAPPPANSEAAAHKREIERDKVAHELREAEAENRHERRMRWAMLAIAVLAAVAIVTVGVLPGIDYEMKKIVIGTLFLFITNGSSYRAGKSAGAKI